MPSHDYFPSVDDELSVWAKNVKDNLGKQAAPLGITATEQTAAETAAQQIIDAIAANNAAQKAALQSTQTKKTAIAGAEKVLRTTFRRAKTAPGYTPAIGQALGIIGSDDATDWDTYKPTLSATTFPGHVMLKFLKGATSGVNIYTRLKGTAAWTKLAFDSSSPYVDNREVTAGPENREYMAIAVLHDAEVGQQSDIVSVAFAG